MSTNEVAVPKEQDYHGHPNYGKIYLLLLALLGVSLVVGFAFSPLLAVLLIFLTAIIKAVLVVGNFMHLKFEPMLIWVAVGIVLFIILSFYFGVYPDITAVKPDHLAK